MLILNIINLFWFLIFLVPILFLYFLRYLNRKQPVSSNYLWQKLINKTQGFISLKKWSIILLIIQIITAFFGVFSLTKATLKIKKHENPGVVFLLDVSASMNVKENSGNNKKLRIDIAKDIIIEEIKKLKKNRSIALFLCDTDAKLIHNPTKNHNKIIFKLKSIKAGQSSFNTEEVCEKVNKWLLSQQVQYEGYLVSDGTFKYSNKLEKIFNNYFNYSIVGTNMENINISGLRITRDKKVNYTIINNFNTSQNINITLTYNDEIIYTNSLTVPKGISHHTNYLNKVNIGRYKISIDDFDDYFLDNEFYFTLNKPYKIKILLLGEENIFINSILNNIDLFEIKKINKLEELKYSENDFDLIINNNEIIPIDLKNNILSFGFIPENNLIKKGIKINGELNKTDNLHPLLRYIDVAPINVYEGTSIKKNNSLLNLFYIDDYPVTVLFMDRGYSKIVFGFNLNNSNLGTNDIFPVFINNFFKWKIPQWENPLAYNFNTGREYLIYYNKKFKDVENKEITINKVGPYLKIKPIKAGFYNLKLDNEVINISSNLEFSELDIIPKELPYNKNTKNITLNIVEKNISLIQLSIIIFIFFLLLEWILWNTNLIANKKE